MPGEVLLNLICKLYHIRNPLSSFGRPSRITHILRGNTPCLCFIPNTGIGWPIGSVSWPAIFTVRLKASNLTVLPPCGILRPARPRRDVLPDGGRNGLGAHLGVYVVPRRYHLAGSGSQQNGCHGAGPWRRGHALCERKAFGTRRAEWSVYRTIISVTIF